MDSALLKRNRQKKTNVDEYIGAMDERLGGTDQPRKKKKIGASRAK